MRDDQHCMYLWRYCWILCRPVICSLSELATKVHHRLASYKMAGRKSALYGLAAVAISAWPSEQLLFETMSAGTLPSKTTHLPQSYWRYCLCTHCSCVRFPSCCCFTDCLYNATHVVIKLIKSRNAAPRESLRS